MNKMKFLGWTLLVFTTISIALEIIGAAVIRDKTPDTWTEIIVEWIPWELSLAIYGALAIWVPAHFYKNYRDKQRRDKATAEAIRHTELDSVLESRFRTREEGNTW